MILLLILLLLQINATRGLGFDLWDLEFYETLFKEKLKRDPTDVELFDMGQARDLGCTKMIVNTHTHIHTLGDDLDTLGLTTSFAE